MTPSYNLRNRAVSRLNTRSTVPRSQTGAKSASLAPDKAEANQNEAVDEEEVEAGTAVTSGDGGTTSVTVLNEDMVKVTIVREIKTTLICPCPNTCCTTKMAIGTHGSKGGGQITCPHCKARPKHACWVSGADFKKHVHTKRCQDHQQVRVVREPTPKQALGRSLAHKIDGEEFIVENEAKEEKFQCPVKKCGKTVKYGHRYTHCVACFRKNGIHKVGDLDNQDT